MQSTIHDTDGILGLVRGIYSYFEEMDGYRRTCERHAETAAIHTKGKELQVYRLFARNADTANTLRSSANNLPSWDKSPFWKTDGEKWSKLEQDIEGRMTRHKELHPIVTRGISWESKPLLIHAYKFEPDPVMKVEIIAPNMDHVLSELPIALISKILECHEYLVPEYQGKPLPPYHRHETHFETVWEYLSHSMPKELYASQCFPRTTQS